MPRIDRTRTTATELRAAFAAQPFAVASALSLDISKARLRACLAAGYLTRVRHGVLQCADRASGATGDPETGPAFWSAAHERAIAAHIRSAQALARAQEVRIRAGAAAGRLRDPAAGDLPTQRAEAGGCVVSHATAAVLDALPYPGLRTPSQWPVAMTSVTRSGSGSPRWRLHRAPLPDHHVTRRAGLWTTTNARTAIDVARTRPLVESLPVVDAACRRLIMLDADDRSLAWESPRDLAADPGLRAAALAELRSALEDLGDVAGRRRAGRALGFVDPGADNPFESVSRAWFIRERLPVPVAGVAVLGADGRTYWADLAQFDHRVIGEADGRGKYESPADLYREKQRQEALERAGWVVVRWTWDELASDPLAVVHRIAAALARRSA